MAHAPDLIDRLMTPEQLKAFHEHMGMNQGAKSHLTAEQQADMEANKTVALPVNSTNTMVSEILTRVRRMDTMSTPLTDDEISAVIGFTIIKMGHIGWMDFGRQLLYYNANRDKLAAIMRYAEPRRAVENKQHTVMPGKTGPNNG